MAEDKTPAEEANAKAEHPAAEAKAKAERELADAKAAAEQQASGLRQQLEKARQELAAAEDSENRTADQLKQTREALQRLEQEKVSRGFNVAGGGVLLSSTVRPDHQMARMKKVWPHAKPSETGPPKPVKLHTFEVQDLAQAQPPMTVTNCVDESEAKRVFYAQHRMRPSQMRVRVRKAA